jgi:SPP1 gp7 family putative phage head morphogenesis protein
LSAENPLFKNIFKTASNAFKKLHEKGNYEPKDLLEIPEFKALHENTNALFSNTIQFEVSNTLKAYLEKDAFVFSGLRTHAQLADARSYLKDEKGNVRSYNDFEQKVLKLNAQYNQNYLQAEYNFAIQSGLSAEKWETFSDDDKRYYLQYRTAKDGKVRDSHAALDETTLPKSDPFWSSYMPPNGWNCRCTTVEVLASDYSKSDSSKAITEGEKATTQIGKNGKNKAEMFRFNPGSEKKIFPKNNTYTKIAGAKEVENLIEEKNVPQNINTYEKKLGIKINRDMFKQLKVITDLNFTNPKGVRASGAYYLPGINIVVIPIDQRRLRSKWKAESVVYHEFGHALDWQRSLKKMPEVKDLMDKYRKNIDFKKVDSKLKNMYIWAYKKQKWDLVEKTGATMDVIMSLNTKYGDGHSQAYWKKDGAKEAEFIAHAFENKYAGNEVFSKYLPELYKESIKMIEKIILK